MSPNHVLDSDRAALGTGYRQPASARVIAIILVALLIGLPLAGAFTSGVPEPYYSYIRLFGGIGCALLGLRFIATMESEVTNFEDDTETLEVALRRHRLVGATILIYGVVNATLATKLIFSE